MSKTTKHKQATRRYKKEFYLEHGYYFCELCLTNNSLAWSVHHIMSAGRYPGHRELHNKSNLILLCIECHSDVHSGVKLNDLIEERGLKELFGGVKC